MKFLHDRADITKDRFTRLEPRDPTGWNRELLKFVDRICPGGVIFHITRDIPDDSGDEMTIVIDGKTVVHFELPREPGVTQQSGVCEPPINVEIETLEAFRWRCGQRAHRRLDSIAADARRMLNR